MVYAVFYRGSGIGGALVRWWTKSKFGHASLNVGDDILDQTVIYEALGWRKKFPWWRGQIIKRPLKSNDYRATFVECPWADEAAVIKRCEAALTCCYDWPAVVLSAEQKWFRGGFSLADKRTGAYDCSRFVQYALSISFDGTPTPQDIYALTTAKLGVAR